MGWKLREKCIKNLKQWGEDLEEEYAREAKSMEIKGRMVTNKDSLH